jgi:hypothetical protein
MLFLTHHKCASAWLSGVLHSYYAEQCSQPVLHSHRSDEFPEDCAAYRYLLLINAHYPFLKDKLTRAVHVVRNPLSIVVSSYFSHLATHPTERWPQLAVQREKLQRLPKAAGLEATVQFLSRPQGFHDEDGVMGPLWSLRHFDYDDPRILTVRMEDLVAAPAAVLPECLAFLGAECPADLLAQLSQHSFEAKSGGRKPGVVDTSSHYRCGDPSDWINHLSRDCALGILRDHAPFMNRFYSGSAALLQRHALPGSSAGPLSV